MVSNLFINKSLKFIQAFAGTYSCNNIPIIKSYRAPVYFIINLDIESGEGTHFVYLEIFGKTALFWDPLGFSIRNNHIKEYLRRIKIKKIKCVTQQIQDFNSISCGLFCIALGKTKINIFKQLYNWIDDSFLYYPPSSPFYSLKKCLSY